MPGGNQPRTRGERGVSARRRSWRGDQPRTRGEQPRVSGRAGVGRGPTPHARGAAGGHRLAHRHDGTNPARAGSSLADLGFHSAQSLSPASFKDSGNAGECLIPRTWCPPSTRPPLNPTDLPRTPPFQPLTPRPHSSASPDPTPHPPPSPNPTPYHPSPHQPPQSPPSNPPRRPADPNRIHPVPRPHLPRSRSDVVPHGPVRQAQPPGDLRHRVPLCGPAQHSHLAW